MKKTVRIIPRLDIKGQNVIKGIHLEGLRVLGKPEQYAKYYYETGADELLYVDAVASLYNRNSLHDIITKTAKELFIPLTVGGGIRTIDDIRLVLRAGADKIAINTVAIDNPHLIKEASKMFGSSTIVISIEAMKQSDGKYFAFTKNGREYTGVEVVSWAKKVEELGAGEILLTSVDKEGTGTGFDIDLIRKITDIVSIPVIASGGAGSIDHIVEVIKEGNVDGVVLASMLHYYFIKNHKNNMSEFQEGNTDFLKTGNSFSKIKISGIPEIKKRLKKEGIDCRL